MNKRKVKRFAIQGILGIGLLLLVLLTVYLAWDMNKLHNLDGHLSYDTLNSMKTRWVDI